VEIVKDPREAACHVVAEFLQSSPNIPFDFSDCLNYASDNDSLVQAYIGRSPVDPNSSKYRDIADRFKQGLVGGGFISIVNMHSLRLLFSTTLHGEKNNE